MSKRFITLKDVEQQINNGKIYLDKKVILSSSLQDYIREHNIQVVYGEEETCSVKPSVEDCACLKEEVYSKKLLDLNKVKELEAKGTRRIVVENSIVTSSAEEYAKEKNIEIIKRR